jgi:hypothetical protein
MAPAEQASGNGWKTADICARLLAAKPHATAERRHELLPKPPGSRPAGRSSRCGTRRRSELVCSTWYWSARANLAASVGAVASSTPAWWPHRCTGLAHCDRGDLRRHHKLLHHRRPGRLPAARNRRPRVPRRRRTDSGGPVPGPQIAGRLRRLPGHGHDDEPAIRISSLAAGLTAAGGGPRAADAGRQDRADVVRLARHAGSTGAAGPARPATPAVHASSHDDRPLPAAGTATRAAGSTSDRCTHCTHHRAPPEGIVNSVVRGMSIMYVRCVSVRRHQPPSGLVSRVSPRSGRHCRGRRPSWCSWLCTPASAPRGTGRFRGAWSWPLRRQLCQQDCAGNGVF